MLTHDHNVFRKKKHNVNDKNDRPAQKWLENIPERISNPECHACHYHADNFRFIVQSTHIVHRSKECNTTANDKGSLTLVYYWKMRR